MINSRWIYLALGALTCLTAHAPARAMQSEEIRLIEYESLEYRRVDGREMLHIVSPILEQGETRLEADQAVDEGDGIYRFTGNVVIIEEGDTLRANYVRYHEDTKTGSAEGDVRLFDGAMEVFAPFGTYYVDEKKATFDQSVTFADSSSVLTALRGTYYTEEERGQFEGNVVLRQEDAIVFADSMVHNRLNDLFEALGRVAFRRENPSDSTGSTLLADRLIHYGSLDSTFAEGRVMLAQYDVVDPDTLSPGPEPDGDMDLLYLGDGSSAIPGDATFLLASRISMLSGGDRDVLTAVDSVVVSAPDVAVRADSLVTRRMEDDGDESRFFGRPMAWLQETQLSADSLYTRGREARVDSVLGFGNVFVASRDSASGHIQQLQGRRLVVYLEQDTLRYLEVISNAEAIFYTQEEGAGNTRAVKGSSDSIRFYFAKGELDRIGYYSQVEGQLYSENLFDQLQNLQGYIWVPDQRPSRESILFDFRSATADRAHTTPFQDDQPELPIPWR